MKIERQLQGTLSTIFTEVIKERKLEAKISPHLTSEEGRADLMLKTAKGKPIFFIELKDPTAKDGITIFNSDIILREIERAQRLNIKHFGICNFKELTLIEVSKLGEKATFQENLFTLNELNRLRQNYNPTATDIQQKFRNIASYYIDRAVEIIEKKPIQFPPIDELYIFKIRKLIEAYSPDVTEKAYEKHLSDAKFHKAINKYAESQQWNAPQSRDEMEKLVHIALLVLVSKLIFYKTYYDYNSTENRLSEIKIAPEMTLPEELEAQLWEYFEEFKKVTKNFETLIGEKDNIIAKIPFVSDASIDLVKEVIQTGKQYDFSKIQYDVIGRIFEELIREDERHKLGQYFTPPMVIDFINAFCIHRKDDVVLDPSCGSGTFLIRAYQRKKELGQTQHADLLKEIYGCDISNYPAYLATLNLAIRNMQKASYPRVLNEDFFHFLRQNKYLFHLPNGKAIKQQPPLFDAIVGNPPYTRQEDINAFKSDAKDNIKQVIKEEWRLIDNTQKVEVSQRTSIYGYFLYHAGALLKEGGYMGFIVGNSWLSTDYGEEMQAFMLQNFEVIAIIETEVERFFPAADVNTNIFILRRQSDAAKRNAHITRFVYLTEKLALIQQKYKSFDLLIKDITLPPPPPHIPKNEISDFKLQYIPQSDLALNSWSLYFKAPPVYWKIVEKAKGKLVQLDSVTTIRRGITTGCNEFFYGEDVTDTIKEKQVVAIVNNTKELSLEEIKAKELSILKNGLGELWLIESCFLRLAILSPKDSRNYQIIREEINGYFFVIDYSTIYYEGITKLEVDNWLIISYPYAYSYILHGEQTEVHLRQTCASRKIWYQLLNIGLPSMGFNYMINDVGRTFLGDILFGDNFHVLYTKENTKNIWLYLNSTISWLIQQTVARTNFGGGVMKIQTYEFRKFPILLTDLSHLNIDLGKTINYKIELGIDKNHVTSLQKVNPERLKLDNAILDAIGFTNQEEKNMILIELYESLADIIISRLQKSKSLDSTRQKREGTNFSVYEQALAEAIQKQAVNITRNITSGRKLQELIQQITQDLKLQDKLLQSYWKAAFGEKYNENALQKEGQRKLF